MWSRPIKGQDRGVQVVHVDGLLGRRPDELVGDAEAESPPFTPPPASQLGATDEKRVIQEPPPLQAIGAASPTKV